MKILVLIVLIFTLLVTGAIVMDQHLINITNCSAQETFPDFVNSKQLEPHLLKTYKTDVGFVSVFQNEHHWIYVYRYDVRNGGAGGIAVIGKD